MAEGRGSGLFLKIGIILLGIIVLASMLAGTLLWRRSKSGSGRGSITVECGTDAPSSFYLGGEEHQVRLLEAVGSSARVVFSSGSPSEATLTVGQPAEVDLDSDGLPDASATLLELSSSQARIRLTPRGYLAWDESGFTVQGGLRNFYSARVLVHDFSVVPEEDGYLLFYPPYHRRLVWERYRPDGSRVTEPGLQVGVVDPGVSDGKVYEVDGALLEDGVALAVRTKAGISVRAYDRHLYRGGRPLHIGKNMKRPVLVKGGDDLFVVTEGACDPPYDSAASGIVVTRVLPGNSPTIMRQRVVRSLQRDGGEIELRCHDAAWDEETGSLAVLFTCRHYAGERRNPILWDLQLMLIDPQTLDPVRTTTICAGSTDVVSGCLAVRGGKATVVWSRGQFDLLVSTADLAGGEAVEVWKGRRGYSAPRYFTVNHHCQLLEGAGGDNRLQFAYWHGSNVRPLISGEGFLLRLWEGDHWAASDTVLAGMVPKLADPLLDLNAFGQFPQPAVCGGPVSLKGKVINRGSQRANQVTVTASVDGREIGSAELGNMDPVSSAPFSITWIVPADYREETAEVTFTLTTSSRQYTTGNDTAAHTISVRQKGLVFGRVTDASSDVRHRLGYYPCMPNVRVTVGDRQALTDSYGGFTIDGLDFGTYGVKLEHEGYNTLETQVTVSRTKPMAFVRGEMDNHGVMTLEVVDENGKPLEGVNVYLHDYQESERTPASGKLTWDISAGKYTFSFTKRGYHPVGGQEVEVVLGEERTQTVTMREIATGFLGGMVVERRGKPVGGALVTIRDDKGNVVNELRTGDDGIFQPVELPAKPSKVYRITVSWGDMTTEENVLLYGGDQLFQTFKLVPGLGEKRVRSATQGYTSWMVKAGWPGLSEIAGADMYAWFGNYAICVGAEYWSGTKDLAAVNVSVWGGSYESHATKSEIDISGWFEPEEEGSVFDITKWADIPEKLIEDHSADLLDIADALINNFHSADDEYIITGQGSELLTWKEARSDFAPKLEFDSSDPLHSMWDVVEAVPRSFAIPVVFGGSSAQRTAVRVDQVDVVHMLTGELVSLSRPAYEWLSCDGPEGTDNCNGKRYEVTQEEIPYDEVVVYVWLTVQKYWGGEASGTCFTQREKQVVVFKPGPQTMKGYIAPGDLYRNPSLISY